MSNVEIGNRIREIREKRKLSRESLAEKAGISTKFLYEIESGKKGLSANTLLKISNSLSCSCDYLLAGTLSRGHKAHDLISILNKFDESQIKKLTKIMKLLYEITNN